jgi:hypothetical protein
MKNRFRVEIYDANKQHDVTLFTNEKVDREYLSELVISNIKNFEGTVKAFAFDNIKKKKVSALLLDESVVQFIQNTAAKATRLELDLV